jgi:hypothetical protein
MLNVKRHTKMLKHDLRNPLNAQREEDAGERTADLLKDIALYNILLWITSV